MWHVSLITGAREQGVNLEAAEAAKMMSVLCKYACSIYPSGYAIQAMPCSNPLSTPTPLTLDLIAEQPIPRVAAVTLEAPYSTISCPGTVRSHSCLLDGPSLLLLLNTGKGNSAVEEDKS
jgi:hypothetical protein